MRNLIEKTLKDLNAAENRGTGNSLEHKLSAIDSTMSPEWMGWSDGELSADRSAERKKEHQLFTFIRNYHRQFDQILIDPPFANVLWSVTGQAATNGFEMNITGSTTFEFGKDGKILKSWVFTANRPSPSDLGMEGT